GMINQLGDLAKIEFVGLAITPVNLISNDLFKIKIIERLKSALVAPRTVVGSQLIRGTGKG
ncbi:hypothetical protein, partial [Pseudomonas viridiflava]|uniref:hypothetical protein n=1 Tax=Pseudomonas viridiflava TaxID=33069 RepID=UPI0013E0A2F0